MKPGARVKMKREMMEPDRAFIIKRIEGTRVYVEDKHGAILNVYVKDLVLIKEAK